MYIAFFVYSDPVNKTCRERQSGYLNTVQEQSEISHIYFSVYTLKCRLCSFLFYIEIYQRSDLSS